VGAPSPSISRETEEAECGRPPGPEQQTGDDFLLLQTTARCHPGRAQREPGSSKHRPSDQAVCKINYSEYWVPAFAGTTAESASRLLAKRNQARANSRRLKCSPPS